MRFILTFISATTLAQAWAPVKVVPPRPITTALNSKPSKKSPALIGIVSALSLSLLSPLPSQAASQFETMDFSMPSYDSTPAPALNGARTNTGYSIPTRKLDLDIPDAPAKAEAPAKFEKPPAPKFDAPKFEAPKFDKLEVPKFEKPAAPKFDAPKFDAPKFDKPDLPKFEKPKVDLPKFDTPKFDAPKVRGAL